MSEAGIPRGRSEPFICRRPEPLAQIPLNPSARLPPYGASVEGMSTLWVYRGSDGALMIYDGVSLSYAG